MADGSINAAGCNQYPAPRSAGDVSSGLPWQQQMQLNMALGAEQAAVNAFVKWLLSPTPNNDSQRRAQEERKRRIIEAEKRRLEELERQRRLKIEKDRQEMLGEWKGTEESETAWKEVSPDAPLDFKDFDARVDEMLAGLQSQAKAIDCTMGEIFDAAEKLGPEGKKLAAELRGHLLEFEKKLAVEQSGGATTGCNIVYFPYDSANAGVKGSLQMTVNMKVVRFNNTGERRVDIMYSLSDGKRAVQEGLDKVHLNSAGGIDCQAATGAAAKCLSRFHPDSSATDYCPKPPPEHPMHPGPGGYDDCASDAKTASSTPAAASSPADPPPGGSATKSTDAAASLKENGPLADLHKHFKENEDKFNALHDYNGHIQQSIADRERAWRDEADPAAKAKLKKTLVWCRMNIPLSSAAGWVRQRWEGKCSTTGGAPAQPAQGGNAAMVEGMPLK